MKADSAKNLYRRVTRNAALKLLSFVFAVGMWFYVSYQMPEAEEPKEVALVLRNMPQELIRTSDIISKIDIIVKGPSARLRRIDPGYLLYELDLAEAGPGKLSFKIIDTRIKGLPISGVRVIQFSPTEITLTLSERLERTLPVEVVTRGEPARGYVVEQKSVEPALVKVSGAREEVENLKSVATEVVDLAGRRESYFGEHTLDLRGRHIELLDAEKVRVRIQIVPDLVQRAFDGIAVTVENTTLGWRVTPGTLDLRLKGPAEMMRNIQPEGIRLVVDASGKTAGEYRVKPRLFVPGTGEGDVVTVGLDLPEVTLDLRSQILQTGKKKKKSP